MLKIVRNVNEPMPEPLVEEPGEPTPPTRSKDKPSPLDPALIELVRALGRDAARRDHERALREGGAK